MTQKETLDAVLGELRHIKKHMPNGELKAMQTDMEALKDDMSDLKYTLLNPENGVIVNTNKNTDFRQMMQGNQKEFDKQMLKITELENWKMGVTRALWIIFGIMAGIIIRMFMMHGDQI